MNPAAATWRDLLYLTEARAIALGFTHEGRAFGVPAWLAEPEAEEVIVCPKVPVLQAWAMLADCLLELASGLIHADEVLEAPIHATRPLLIPASELRA